MKHRIVFLSLLLTGCASSDFSRELESFSNETDTVCLEVQGKKFGLSIETSGGTHEILGNGTLEKKRGFLSMEYVDSFDNKVKGTFDPRSGVLDLNAVKADIWTPSATMASYGRYVLSRKKCTSNVLE